MEKKKKKARGRKLFSNMLITICINEVKISIQTFLTKAEETASIQTF